MAVKTPTVSARNYKVGTKRKGRTGRTYVVAMRKTVSGRRVRSWRPLTSRSRSSRSGSSKRSKSRSRSSSKSRAKFERFLKYNRYIRSPGRKGPRQSATLYRIGTENVVLMVVCIVL